MSKETEEKSDVKPEVPAEAPVDGAPAEAPATEPVAPASEAGQDVPFEPLKMVMGEVTIKVGPQGLAVSHPQNLLIALAIIDAGRLWVEMQYTDAIRAAQKAQPKIVRAGAIPPSRIEEILRRPS